MPKESESFKELVNIMNGLADSTVEMSDQDILTEIREEGKDPERTAEEIRSLLLSAVDQYCGANAPREPSPEPIRHRVQKVRDGLLYSGQRFWLLLRHPRVLVTVASILAIITVSTFYIRRSPISKLGLISEAELTRELDLGYRGPAEPSVESGLKAFQRRDFKRAYEILSSVVKQDSENYEAHYYLGLLYLVESTRGILVGRNGDKINQGIEHLILAKPRAPNRSFLADCYFYLAKAHLLKGDSPQAEKYLQDLLALNDSSEQSRERAKQAKELLRQMEFSKSTW